MSTETRNVIQYDDNNYAALTTELKTLSTFAQIVDWDKRAKSEVERIISIIQALNAEIDQQNKAMEQARQAHSEKSFFGRMLSNREDEKKAAESVTHYQELIERLEALASEMQESIDFSPNSSEEQKALVKELRQRKKDLQLQKREVAANMKAIRGQAQQLSANAGKGFLGLYDSKLAAYERRQIRYSKHATLGPQEDIKAAIERLMIQVDRDILWAERFKE